MITRFWMFAVPLLLILLLAAGAGLWRGQPRPEGGQSGAGAKFLRLVREAESRFPESVTSPLRFPDDHGAHPDVPGEILEIAGWFRDSRGEDRAFRFSLARLGWLPSPPHRPSAWSAGAAYRGLFALAGAPDFWVRERFERAALSLAGFDAADRRWWLDGWSIKVWPDGDLALTVGGDEGRLTLRLRALKPPVSAGSESRMQGYMMSRLSAEGRLDGNGQTLPLTATAWLDHAWGRLLPPGGQVAVDRFRLQADDGRELSLLGLRRRDGSAPPLYRGLLIGVDGRAESLAGDDIRLTPSRHWQSPATGQRYPVSWRLALPDRGIELELVPLVENQEVKGALTGWSGAVQVHGSGFSGHGFVDVGG